LNAFDGTGKRSYQLGQEAAQWAETVYDHPALIVMSAGLDNDGEQLVSGIVDTTNGEAPLFGCAAGYDPAMVPDNPKTTVFTSTQLFTHGVVALVFDPDIIEVKGVAASGWKGVGTPKSITKAVANVIYRIDDEPALDVIDRYLNIGGDPELAVEYPLIWKRDDGSSVMRAVVSINADKSVVYGGAVPEGAKVRFGMPPGFEIAEHAIDHMSIFSKQVPHADAMVLFSCRARHLALGPMVNDEISAIRKLWEVPLVGSFTFGEIGPGLHERCDYQNYTIVAVLIDEK
jgi:hypothetical protein